MIDKERKAALLCFNSKRCDYEAVGAAFACFFYAGFNSKRCDYEKALKIYSTLWMRFNSKRCDYEACASFTHNSTLSSFNSKRCDYEFNTVAGVNNASLFQFQKVRL